MNPSWEALRGQMGERFYHLATRWLEDSPPGWPEALPQLLEAVPGVQGASLLLREGEGYSLVAQVGYDDTLLGARESLADSLRWYGGDLEGWQNGEMRRRRELPGLAATFEERDTRYMQHGGLAEIQESLIAPLAFEGEVWGFLNLDTFEAAGFPAGLETLCQDLAAQLCLLLASWRQQSAARRRQTLLEAVADGHGVLRQVHGTQALYDAALSALLEHTRAESGWILRENPEGFEVVSQRGLEGNPLEGGGVFLVALLDHAHPTLYLSLKDREETFSPEEQVFTRALAEALGLALEREGALAEAQERTATLRSVAELSALLESLTDPEAIARQGLEVALGFTGFELGGYFLSVHNRVHKQFLVGEYPEAFEQLYQGRQKAGEGLVGASLAQGQLLFVPDYASSHYALEDFARDGLVSALAAPVGQSAAIALGSLRRRVELTPESQALVAFLARRVEWALERLKHLEQIQRTRDSAFRALGLVLEYRDYVTKGHTDRVVALGERFGMALGLAETELEALCWGAYLHDIGKIAIPDAVLLKPGSLSEAEWATIRRHPLIGYEMLSGLPELPAGTLQVVRHHHERWDGGGYPDGLAGAAIPLPARIFALVDVYDALTSPRPYKAAWSRRKVRAEIRSQAAQQFDPELVEVFSKL
ncbi:MAG TPA: HD domain-containing phosphohydrolase [Meiothermus sp.]|nr:HD domain-containing phosphohydrolase [Meiothermus sp.]